MGVRQGIQGIECEPNVAFMEYPYCLAHEN